MHNIVPMPVSSPVAVDLIVLDIVHSDLVVIHNFDFDKSIHRHSMVMPRLLLLVVLVHQLFPVIFISGCLLNLSSFSKTY